MSQASLCVFYFSRFPELDRFRKQWEPTSTETEDSNTMTPMVKPSGIGVSEKPLINPHSSGTFALLFGAHAASVLVFASKAATLIPVGG